MWFGVADNSGVASSKVAGEYAFEVTTQADVVYYFNFVYNPFNVTALPEPEVAAVDYTAVWNQTAGKWFIKVQPTQNLNKDTVKAISLEISAGKFVKSVAITPTTENGLLFAVAELAGDLAFAKAGVYTYKVEKLDGTLLSFTFDYKPSLVTSVTHTIKFNSNDGSAVETITLEKGKVPTKPADPVRTGYTFEGWFADDKLTKAFDWTAQLNVNFELYAKWNAITYNVVYHNYATRNDMFEALIIDFYNWSGATEDLMTFMHGADKTSGFDGLWISTDESVVNKYRLKIYNGQRPTAYNTDYFISSPGFMEKWLPLFDIVDTFVKVVNNTQYFWGESPDVGLIRLRQFAMGTKPNANPTDELMNRRPAFTTSVPSFNITSEDLILVPIYKQGYEFIGYFDNPEFKGEIITKIAKGTHADVHLYPKYIAIGLERVQYTVSFNNNGEVSTAKVGEGLKVVKPEDPTRQGYVFKGWYKDDKFKNEYDFNHLTVSDFTLYAKWELKPFTLTYETNGGKLAYANRDAMKVALLTDFYNYLGLSSDLMTFIHGEGKTTGYKGTWEASKPKLYAGPKPTAIDNNFFISSEQYMNKWLPFFDLMDVLVKEINKDQYLWGASTYVGLIRFSDYYNGTRYNDAKYDRVMNWNNENKFNLTKDEELRPAVKDGFTFKGWYTTEDFQGDPITKIAALSATGDLKVYAKWEAKAPVFTTKTYDFAKAGASGSTTLEPLSTWTYNSVSQYTYGGTAFRGNDQSIVTKDNYGTISGKVDVTLKAGGNSGTQVMTIQALDKDGAVVETKEVTCVSINTEAKGLELADQKVTFDNASNNITAFKIVMVTKVVNTILYKVVIGPAVA